MYNQLTNEAHPKNTSPVHTQVKYNSVTLFDGATLFTGETLRQFCQ